MAVSRESVAKSWESVKMCALDPVLREPRSQPLCTQIRNGLELGAKELNYPPPPKKKKKIKKRHTTIQQHKKHSNIGEAVHPWVAITLFSMFTSHAVRAALIILKLGPTRVRELESRQDGS